MLLNKFSKMNFVKNTQTRCSWTSDNKSMIEYHDTEWGVPVHDDKKLFEYLVLDAFQAGLSWNTILKKRENFRSAFDGFDAGKIAKYEYKETKKLLNDAGIVRNRLKIAATIINAQGLLEVQKEFGTFDKYIWQFVSGKTIKNKFRTLSQIPAKTKESEEMSRDLQKRGFKFVGPTICYAFMQAAGMVNDHLTHCFRYKQV